MSAQATVPLEKAKRLEPEKTSIREALGIAYFRLRRWQEAEAEFRAVLELSPTEPYAHYALGRALEHQGREWRQTGTTSSRARWSRRAAATRAADPRARRPESGSTRGRDGLARCRLLPCAYHISASRKWARGAHFLRTGGEQVFEGRCRWRPVNTTRRRAVPRGFPHCPSALPGVEVLALELTGKERFCVYVDQPGGVDHALCERVSGVLAPYLDRWSIEVSSPGHRAAAAHPRAFRAGGRAPGAPEDRRTEASGRGGRGGRAVVSALERDRRAGRHTVRRDRTGQSDRRRVGAG